MELLNRGNDKKQIRGEQKTTSCQTKCTPVVQHFAHEWCVCTYYVIATEGMDSLPVREDLELESAAVQGFDQVIAELCFYRSVHFKHFFFKHYVIKLFHHLSAAKFT